MLFQDGQEAKIMIKQKLALLALWALPALVVAQEPPLANPPVPATQTRPAIQAKPITGPAMAAPPTVVDPARPAVRPTMPPASPKNQPRVYSYPTPVHPLCVGCQGLGFPPPPPVFVPPCLPCMPFQGMVPAGNPGGFQSHPFTRSPRDYFMLDIPR